MLSKLVERIPSGAPFEAPESLEKRLGVSFVARLGANESAWGPSPRVVAAIQAEAASVAFYGDPQSEALRVELGSRLGWDPAAIRVACGIDDLLGLLCRLAVDAGAPVVTTQGSYPTFGFGAAAAGATLVTVPYRDARPDLEALGEAAHQVGASLVYLANPDNPSGWFHSRGDVEAFQRSLPADCWLLLDEAYADFVPASSLPVFGEGARVLRTRTFSKAYGLAGMRVGFVHGPVAAMEGLDRIRPHFGVSRLGQIAALEALRDVDFLEQVLEEAKLSRGSLVALGEAQGWRALPSSTNFVLFRLEGVEAAEATLHALLRAGIFVRKPGVGALADCLRISLGTTADLAALEARLGEVRVGTSPGLGR